MASILHQVELTKHNLRLLIFEDVLHYHPDCRGLIQPTLDAATAAMPDGGGAQSQRPNGAPSGDGDGNGAAASEAAGAGPLPQPPSSESRANACADGSVAANGGGAGDGAINGSTTSPTTSTAPTGEDDPQVHSVRSIYIYTTSHVFVRRSSTLIYGSAVLLANQNRRL